MPMDKYRNVGPDDSVDYHAYEDTPIPDYNRELKALISDEGGNRVDGRMPNEIRKIYLKAGVVSSVKGSAYSEVGHTKILVSVYEPKEIPRLSRFCPNGELNVEFRFATFSGKTRTSPLMQNEEKQFSRMVKHALEPVVCRSEFPNCQVEIYVLVVDNDGSCLAAAINTAGLALADAGIPMYDMIAAVQLGKQNDRIFVDPTLEEEQFCSKLYKKESKEMGLLTISYMPTIGQFSCSSFAGCGSSELITSHLDLMINLCKEITQLSQEILAHDVAQKHKSSLELVEE